ncbi:MAG: putative membrane protein YfcA [Candidatus Endobugula sp.]
MLLLKFLKRFVVIMFLEPHILVALAFIALFTGFVKAGLPSLGALVSVSLVLLFPVKDALGLAVLYLLAGDLVASFMHWRKANLPLLIQLLPAIFFGIGLGALTLTQVSNDLLGALIGVLIVLMVGMEPFRPRVSEWSMRNIYFVRSGSGVLAGFSTTVGNAAGPILSLYFLLLKIDKYGFVGTAALFFLIVNVTKLPLYGALGMFKTYYLWSYMVTVPFVIVGALLGRRFIEWIPQQYFNRVVLSITGLSGIWLLSSYLMG